MKTSLPFFSVLCVAAIGCGGGLDNADDAADSTDLVMDDDAEGIGNEIEDGDPSDGDMSDETVLPGDIRLRLIDMQQIGSNIMLFVAVTNVLEGTPVEGLTPEDFEVLEDGNALTTENSLEISPRPDNQVWRTLVPFNTSYHMLSEGELETLVSSVGTFSHHITEQNTRAQRVGIASFDGAPSLRPVTIPVNPPTGVDFTASESKLDQNISSFLLPECTTHSDCGLLYGSERPECINGLCVDRSTNLYGAVRLGIAEVESSIAEEIRIGAPRGGALLVITDGPDQAGRVAYDEVLQDVTRTNMLIYTIGIAGDIGEDELEAIGKDGSVIAGSVDETSSGTEQIWRLLQNTARGVYIISYCTVFRGGEHEIEIGLQGYNETLLVDFSPLADALCDPEAASRACTGLSCGAGEGIYYCGDCSSSEFCADGSCQEGCSGGVCCDVATSMFRDADSECYVGSEYACDTSECGGDPQERTVRRYCSGDDDGCSGEFVYEDWTILENCDASQLCDYDDSGAWCVTCPTGQTCEVDRCVPICTPGDSYCESTESVAICNDLGSAYESHPCDPGFVCAFDNCELQICEPLTRRCLDTVTVEECDGYGLAWNPAFTCDASAGYSCHDGACLSRCDLSELQPTNSGCVFYAVDLDQVDEGAEDSSPYAILVVNIDTTVTANVLIEDRVSGTWGTRASQAIAPNSLYTFRLPDHHVEQTNKVAGMAYRVTSDSPVIAYQFNPIDTAAHYSGDASLLLPKSTLDRNYMITSWPKYPGEAYTSEAVIVGTVDGTTVNVTVPVATLAGGSIPALGAGDTTTQSLDEGEVLQIAGAGWVGGDMTGTYVDASSPVAVFGSCECAEIPWNCSWCRDHAGDAVTECGYCDHIEEQMLPTAAWGLNYIAARSPVRSTVGLEASYWRVIASEDATTVNFSWAPGTEFRTLSGAPPFVLNRGQVLDFELAGTPTAPGDALIQADKPILVAQYLEGQECTNQTDDDSGDPAMILMVPQEQYLDNYVFLLPSTYPNNYVVVIKPTTATLTLNGFSVSVTPYPVADGWEIYRLSLTAGIHHIEGTAPFGIILVGYSSSISYGTMGGLGIATINP